MRFLFIILFLLPLVLFGQTNFNNQLGEIIKDSANYFRSFKSGFKEKRFTEAIPDSIFYTKFSLDGTANNELLISAGESIFMADVADSLDEFNGRKTLNELRDKINSVLGNGFDIEEIKSSDGNPSKWGWGFSKGNVIVSIGLFPHKKDASLNWIGLAISVFEEEETVAKKN